MRKKKESSIGKWLCKERVDWGSWTLLQKSGSTEYLLMETQMGNKKWFKNECGMKYLKSANWGGKGRIQHNQSMVNFLKEVKYIN